MSSQEERAAWERNITEIRRVLALLKESLSSSAATEVAQFVQVDEYEVAFEALCWAIRDEGLSIPPAAWDLIEQLGNRLRVQEDTWRPLQARVTKSTKANS